MAIAKMTLASMAQWMTEHNDDLFRYLELPEGVTRDTVIDTIMLRADEFPQLYTNPYYVQSAIGAWSARMGYPWMRMIGALQAEYNPIHNYDRYEDSGDERQTERDTSNSSQSSGSGSNTESVSAYDQTDALTPRTGSTSQDSTQGSSSGREAVKDSNVHSAHLYGNIGVTSSQRMITEEMDLRASFNIYSIIADDFCREFCVMVY